MCSSDLIAIIRELMLANWLDLFDLELTDLEDEGLAGVTFVVNGMLGLIGGSEGLEGVRHPLQVIWSSPVIGRAMAEVPALFEQTGATVDVQVINQGSSSSTSALPISTMMSQ